MATHTYWRVLFSSGNGADIWLDEVEFQYKGAEQPATGGTVLSGGDYSASYPKEHAFDKTIATAGWGSAPGVWPAWIGYQFTTPVNVDSVVLTIANTGSAYDELPVAGAIALEYSDNGSTWVSVGTVSQMGTIAVGAVITVGLPSAMKWWTAVSGLTPIAAYDANTLVFTPRTLTFTGVNPDFLRIPYSSQFNLSTGDFTIEAKFTPQALTGSHLVAKDTYGQNFDWSLNIVNATTLALYTNAVNSNLTVTVPTMVVGTSYHFAFVRRNGINVIYLDGIARGSNTMSITNASQSWVTVGCSGWNNPNSFFKGQIELLRISNVARYHLNFDPPTVLGIPVFPVVDTRELNTILLLRGNGTDAGTLVVDSSRSGKVLTNSGVTTRTAQSKFGGSALYFNGVGNFNQGVKLSYGTVTDFVLPGDFTVGAWVHPLSFGASYGSYVLATGSQSNNSGGWHLVFTASSWHFNFGDMSTPIDSNVVPVANVWTHVAVCRVGTQITMYIGGVAQTTVRTYGATLNAQTFKIGSSGNDAGTTGISGYLAEIEVINGTAKYTGDFTVPDSPVTITPITYVPGSDTNTVLQLEQKVANGVTTVVDVSQYAAPVLYSGSTTIKDRVGTRNFVATSTLSQSTTAPMGVCGNSNPMLASSSIPVPSTGVVLFFYYPKANCIIFSGGPSDADGYLLFQGTDHFWYIKGTGTYTNFGSYGTAFSAPVCAALVTNGSTVTAYVNGNLVGTPKAMSFLPANITQLGYQGAGSVYNLDPADQFYGAGFWTGTATQSDVQKLEAALRVAVGAGIPSVLVSGFECMFGEAYLAPAGAQYMPLTYRTDYLLATQSFMPPEGQANAKPIGKKVEQPRGNKDVYFGGTGTITGTVFEKHLPMNLPLSRRVLLLDDQSRLPLREVWSNPNTGVYTFTNLDKSKTYTTLAFDHTGTYRALSFSGIVPT